MSMIKLSTVMERFDDNDELTLSFPEKPSYPLSKTKLKRLKKTADTYVSRANPKVLDNPMMPISPAAPEPSEIRTCSSDAKVNEGFGDEMGPPLELDPLFAYRSGEEVLGDPYEIETEVREDRGKKNEVEVVVEEPEREKNVKRRLSLDDEEEDLDGKRKKKVKYRKLKGPDGEQKESVREVKRLEKARKVELEHLHAESQRLLRETRDASFKPAQFIQKPISSVLEKIRLRKLEIMKSCKILSSLPSIVDADCAVGSDCNSYQVNCRIGIKEEPDRNALVALDVGAKGTCQNLTNNTQANKNGSQLCTGGHNLVNSQEVCPPYPPTSSLKIDGGGNDDGVASSCDYDVSSSEEDSDKENVGPSVCYVVNNDSSPKDGLAKAFLDDEAEEEDDSDCDLLRFQENEEENETDEDLDELIATGYEEAPMDQERRNELHQKWLEQLDAAETDNVLQRLKSGRQGLRKPTLIHGDYDNYNESDNDNVEDNDCDDDDNEVKYKNHPMDTSRQSLKKAKQMISHMFADANDVYIPSDDEETEKNIFRHHILKHKEEPSFLSPVEDESSREFFGLIKKLNIAPITKKRGKASTTPLFDSLVLHGNSNGSSKSSFLNRTSNSLPPSHKQRSISVRTFIFGRDDSNSKSNISTSEINSDMAEKEGISAKNSTKGKFSSQIKSSVVIKRAMQPDSKTGSSLFNILRQSSVQFDKKLESKSSVSSSVITESQAAHKFSAFKLRRNSKTDSRT